MGSDSQIVLRKKEIGDLLQSDDTRQKLLSALPKVGLTPERMVRVMFSAFNSNPTLMQCTNQSIINAMIQSASLGLEPNTPLGQSYLIPFKDNKTNTTAVQFIIGYKGYISLARRSGEIASIGAYVVHQGDVFEYELGTSPFIRHIPKCDDTPVTHVYAVATLKETGTLPLFEVMTKGQVERNRQRSKAPNSPAWVNDWEQMARKTVIRRIANYLPLSIEMANAIDVDSENDTPSSLRLVNSIEELEMPAVEKKKSPLEKKAEEAKGNKGTDARTGNIAELTAAQKGIDELPRSLVMAAIVALDIKKPLYEYTDTECVAISQKVSALADEEAER